VPPLLVAVPALPAVAVDVVPATLDGDPEVPAAPLTAAEPAPAVGVALIPDG
jgi:hypothetical protein